jgi:putative oxidoreductase
MTQVSGTTSKPVDVSTMVDTEPSDTSASGGVVLTYHALLNWLVQISLPVMRVALGLVYVWYGSLKVAGVSPAAGLVRSMVSVIGSPGWIVPVFGSLEIVIGLWLITGRWMRYLLPLFVAHMLGTLGVLVLLPGASYQHHNPLELTFTGEFVTKNFVLLAAGIAVIAATATRKRAW